MSESAGADSYANMEKHMHFEVRTNEVTGEHAVFGYEPKAGGDSALIAVFEHPIAAASLADVLNYASLLLSFDKLNQERGLISTKCEYKAALGR